jgi:cytochrome P450
MRHMFSDISAFRHDPLAFFAARGGEANEGLVRLRLGPHPIYLVADRELIKPIFKASEEEIDKGRFVQKMSAVIGTNSLTLSGTAHRERRAAIHEQLARGISSSYVPQISSIIREFIARMISARSFDAHATMSALTLRVICDTLFGRGALSRGDEAALINAIKLVEDDLADRMFRVFPDWPWAAFRKRQRLQTGRRIMTHVVERSRHRAANASILKSLEDLKLDSEALRDEILLIMLAGHHTTGSAATWLLYFLATKPDLANALADEAASVTNARGDIDSTKLTKAPVSRAAALEVLRLYPSSYWYSRETKRPVELGGVKLRAGTSLIVSPWQLHRDARYWSDPLTFNTERLHMSNKAYVPFGSGARACVGMGLAIMEMQLLALEIASSCSLTIPSRPDVIDPKPSITLIPPVMQIAIQPRAMPAVASSRLTA